MPRKHQTSFYLGRDTRTLQLRLAAAERAAQASQRELDALHRIAALAQREERRHVVLQEAAREVSAATGFPLVVIELYDEARQLMEAVAATGIALPADELERRAPVGRTLSGLVATSGQALIAPAVQDRPEAPAVALPLPQAQTFVCVPMRVAGQVIAVLALAHPDAVPLDAHLVPLANSLANAIALLIGHRQAEERRAGAEGQLHAILDRLAAGVILIDAEGRFRFANQRAAAMFGLTAAEVTGRSLADLLPPEVAQAYLERNRRIIAAHDFVEYEETFALPVGTRTFFITDQVLPNAQGEGELLLSSTVDITAHVRAEAELEVALTKYRTLFDAFPLGITVSDATGKIVETNAMAERLLGLEGEEHRRREIDGAEWRIVRPDGTPMPTEEYASVRALNEQHVVADVEMGVITPGGETTWINVTAAPLPLADYGVVITYGDITARREAEQALRQLNATLEQRVAVRTADLSATNARLQTEIAVRERVEQALRESEARYRRLADNAPDLIYRFDYLPEPHFSYVNPAATTIIGYSPEEHYADVSLGQRIIHPDDLPLLQRMMADPALLREPTELRWIHHDGSTIWIEQRNVPVLDAEGRLVAIEGIARDVTERKRTSEALRLSEARLHLLLASTPAVIFSALAEGDFRTTFISESIRQVLGYEPAQFMEGDDFWASRIHPEDRARVFGDVAQLFKQGWRQYEYRCRHADGGYRWIETGVSLLPALDGHPAEVIGYMINITARKQAEEALHQANLDLAHAARMKDEFLANMSHELRTPLAAILGRAELLLEQIYGPLTDRQQEAMHSIGESGQHLLRLINDILDLSKIEAGKIELDFDMVEVELCCQQSRQLVTESAMRKGLTLTATCDPEVKSIKADMRRLKQILVNLLSNAVKFTPAGGQVGLEVKGDAARQTVTFTVWDTGIGIAAEDQHRLFQPFVQIDSSLSRQYTGTGLGLALVLHLTGLHGGSVTLESALGAGSCFHVTLPWIRPEGQGDTPMPPSHEAGGALRPADSAGAEVRPVILLAEDHEANIQLLSDTLTSAGYTVAVAGTGEDAVAMAADLRPVLILMDIQMPVMDGLEATRRIRAAGLDETPIIALTALAMPGDRERCLAAGATAYLAKPVNLRMLLELIASTLQAT